MNPRSLFDSPLKEYIAFVHIGKRGGKPGALGDMLFVVGRSQIVGGSTIDPRHPRLGWID